MVKSDPDSVAKVLADDLSYTHSSAKMETKADILKGITTKVQYTVHHHRIHEGATVRKHHHHQSQHDVYRAEALSQPCLQPTMRLGEASRRMADGDAPSHQAPAAITRS